MKTKLFTLLLSTLLAASACTPQAAHILPFTGGSQAWIDAPLPGSRLPLAPVEIVAHAAGSTGIAAFQVSLNGQPLASAQPDPASLDPNMMYMRTTWQPAAPGTYLIEVHALDGRNQPGPSAQVRVEVVGQLPTASPTATATPTPGPLTFTPGFNANCREGPSELFSPLDEPAMQGQPYPLDGRNAAGTWFRIMLTPKQGCWVKASAGTPSGDISGLRVLLEVPTPGTACSAFTDKASCQAQSACQWKLTSSGPGVCENK